MNLKRYLILILLAITVVGLILFYKKPTIFNDKRVQEYNLTEITNKKFNSLMQNVTEDPYNNWDFYKNFAKEAIIKTLPKNLLNTIINMRDKNFPQAIIIHNMPRDNYIPETPRDGQEPKNKGFISEAILLGVCSLLNCQPLVTLANANILDQKPAMLNKSIYIHQIIPLEDAQSKLTQSSSGSLVAFDPHTEAVQEEKPIRFFLLYCVRGDPKVATSLIFLDDILGFVKNHLPKDKTYAWFIEQLKKPQFKMRDSSDIKTAGFEINLPILLEQDGKRVFRFNVNGVRVEGINEEAQYVVDYLKDVLNNNEFKSKFVKKVYLKAGDLLIFNNCEVMHARDSFKIDPNNWRWLQRVYCTQEF